MYGCSYNEFWLDDARIFYYYEEKWKIEQEIRRKIDNQNMWLQGLYFQLAYASCKTDKISYPKSPLAITEEEIRAEKQKQIIERMKKIKV